MDFGAAQAELMPGARNAVETCLAVQPAERVTLIADEASRVVAASLAEALEERRAPWTGLLLEEFAPRPMMAAPPEVLRALESGEVGILCMQPQPGELAARMAIVKVVERRRIRYAHMVGVTPEMMGILLQDEKHPGVHIAFGDPYGSQTHADWASRTHVDVLTRNCDVWIDADQVIANGRYQLDPLGLS